MTEQAYAYSLVKKCSSLQGKSWRRRSKTGPSWDCACQQHVSSKFFLVSDQDIHEIARSSFGADAAVDVFYAGDMGLERAYVVNAVDSASRRIIESQLPLTEPTVVRVLPASFAVSCFIRSLKETEGTYLIAECRPYEIYLYPAPSWKEPLSLFLPTW